MSGVISHDQDGWRVAGWAYRGYLNYVLAEVRHDRALADAVELAISFQGLHLPLEDQVADQRLRPILVRVADEVIEGARPVSVDGRILDARSQDQFRQAVAELRALFTSWWTA